jgi:DNA-binding NtrC family response regulator
MDSKDKLKVLFIDDEVDIIEIYQSLFGGRFDSQYFTDPKKVEINHLEWADVIVTDFKMGDRSGLDILETMFSSGLERPLIFVSAYVPDVLNQIKISLFCEIIEKPANTKILEQMIELYGGFYQEVKHFQNSIDFNKIKSEIRTETILRQINSLKYTKFLKLQLKVAEIKKAA